MKRKLWTFVFLFIILVTVLVACFQRQPPQQETLTGATANVGSDVASGVVFLPPIGTDTVPDAPFDPDVELTIKIFRFESFDASNPVNTPVGPAFSTDDNTIRVELASEQELEEGEEPEPDKYLANWNTTDSQQPNNTLVRVELQLNNAPGTAPACNDGVNIAGTGCLAYFHALLVANKKDKPQGVGEEVLLLVNGQNLPIKFFIQEGAADIPADNVPPDQGDFPAVILSPKDGADVSGAVFFAIQPFKPADVREVRFEAGDRPLEVDAPGEDMFRVFLLPSEFPAGPLGLTVYLTDINGRTSNRSVIVNNVPNPPSTTTVNNGAVLGTMEANGSVSTLTIPPGAAEGANVTFEARTKEEVRQATGVDYDALGVTFLGAQEIDSSMPLNGSVGVSSGGFGPMVQPGQAVVNYMIGPDADGDGIGELVVINTATVAPDGSVISDPPVQVQVVDQVEVVSVGLGTSSVRTQQTNNLVVQPGNVLTFETQGFIAASIEGNKAIFRSHVDGKEVELIGRVKNKVVQIGGGAVYTSGLGVQSFRTIVPVLPAGPATLVLRNDSTNSEIELALTIENAPALSRPAGEIIDGFFANSLREMEAFLAEAEKANADGADIDLSQINDLVRNMVRQREAMQELANLNDPSINAMLRDAATVIENYSVVSTASMLPEIRALQAREAMCTDGYKRAHAAFSETLNAITAVEAVLAFGACATALAAPNPLSAGACYFGFTTLVIGLSIDYSKPFAPPDDCDGDDPSNPDPDDDSSRTVCHPTIGATSVEGFITGMGSALPPGGNGCGNVAAGPPGLTPAAALQTTGIFSIETGRYVIRFRDPNGKVVSSFSGTTDANGYFFIPLIQAGEPFTATAIDRFTGQMRSVDGIGPPIGENITFFFDFLTQENRPPVADAGTNQAVTVSTTVSLDGSNSFDPDFDPLSYAWSISTAPTGSTTTITNPTGVTATLTPDLAGEYRIRLTVSDGELRATDEVTILVSTTNEPVNSPPTANAGLDQTVTAGDAAALDGTASSDPDGDTLSYIWMLTSTPAGSTATLTSTTTATTNFTADLAGEYHASLTVSDEELTDTDAVVITAEAPAVPTVTLDSNIPGTFNAIGDVHLYNFEAAAGTPINLGYISPEFTSVWFAVYAPDGSTVRSGNLRGSGSVSNNTSGIFTLQQDGTYTIELEATNNAPGSYTLGLSRADEVVLSFDSLGSTELTGSFEVIGENHVYSVMGPAGVTLAAYVADVNPLVQSDLALHVRKASSNTFLGVYPLYGSYQNPDIHFGYGNRFGDAEKYTFRLESKSLSLGNYRLIINRASESGNITAGTCAAATAKSVHAALLAVSTNGTVTACPGTYTEPFPAHVKSDGIIFQGAGASDTTLYSILGNITLSIQASGVTVQDLGLLVGSTNLSKGLASRHSAPHSGLQLARLRIEGQSATGGIGIDTNADDSVLQDLVLMNLNTGIYALGNRMLIENNTINVRGNAVTTSSMTGSSIGGDTVIRYNMITTEFSSINANSGGFVIEGNTITKTGTAHGGGTAITVYERGEAVSQKSVVRNNTLRVTTGAGISANAGVAPASVLIEKNLIVMSDPSSMGIELRSIHSSGSGSIVVRNNIINGPGFAGINIASADMIASGHSFDVLNNTYRVADTTLNGDLNAIKIQLASSTFTGDLPVNIANNIFHGRSSSTDNAIVVPVNTTVNSDHNLFFQYAARYAGGATRTGTNDLDGDPLFTTEQDADGDLLLTVDSSSPAIDNGTAAYGNVPSDDYNGTPRPQGAQHDMGAHEQ